LQALRRLADEHDTLLIFDEVMTGFGRTGELFACRRANCPPDIITLSKGITGGFLPLSVTVSTARIYEAFLDEDLHKAFFHSHSYTANPIACAAALESLAILKENPVPFQSMEQLHRELARTYLYPIEFLRNFRFVGTIAAFDVETGVSGYFDPAAQDLKRLFLSNGLLLRPLGHTVYLMPPYCVDRDLLTVIYGKIGTLLKRS
jgi:adenosylmethionine-8-amino-7-oxononanoate aminotransferase